MESRNKLAMCRLCLCENESFINVFELNDGQGYVAAEVISDLLRFQVSETDGYPHVVCSKCIVKLTDFKLFKECCQKSKVKYDNMLVSTESLDECQPEMLEFVTVKAEPILNSDDLDNISKDVGSESDLCDPDPLRVTSPHVTIKSEEVIIDSCPVSDDPLIETEVSCGPILLKYEVLPFSKDNHQQEELIYSEISGNQGTVDTTAVLMQDSPQKEQENIIAPENGVRISKGRFECDHCKKVFTTKSRLIRHMETHGFGNSYICEDEEGGKGTVAEKRIGRRKGRYECHCCRKLLMTMGSLKQHMATHGIGNFFKCDVCGRICVSKSNLIKHIRQHTGERPYKCTSCSAMFTSNSNLKAHIRVHINMKPFKCKECNLSFSQRSNFKSHMRLHSNLRPYSCGVCHAAFRQKSHLTRHMKTHSGDRPYKCTVCSMAFFQSAHLRKHQVVHSGEKPYPCPRCSKRFSHRVSLKRHLKTVCVEKC